MAEEKRRDSSDTVPIPERDLRALLRETYGPEVEAPYDPSPSEAPTQPDMRSPCPRCFDTCKVPVKTDAGTRFEACPDCRPSEPTPVEGA